MTPSWFCWRILGWLEMIVSETETELAQVCSGSAVGLFKHAVTSSIKITRVKVGIVHHNDTRMSVGTCRAVGTRQVKIRVKLDQQDRTK